MPAEEARPGSLPAEIEAVARRAAMMTYALKLEIGEPDHLLVNANVKINEVRQRKKKLTGVRSSSISPAAEAAWSAASIKSSHRFPKSADGSAERAFRSLPGLYRSSFCIRRSQSFAVPFEFFFL